MAALRVTGQGCNARCADTWPRVLCITSCISGRCLTQACHVTKMTPHVTMYVTGSRRVQALPDREPSGHVWEHASAAFSIRAQGVLRSHAALLQVPGCRDARGRCRPLIPSQPPGAHHAHHRRLSSCTYLQHLLLFGARGTLEIIPYVPPITNDRHELLSIVLKFHDGCLA